MIAAPLDEQEVEEMVAVHLDSIARMGRPREEELAEYYQGLDEHIHDGNLFFVECYRRIIARVEAAP